MDPQSTPTPNLRLAYATNAIRLAEGKKLKCPHHSRMPIEWARRSNGTPGASTTIVSLEIGWQSLLLF